MPNSMGGRYVVQKLQKTMEELVGDCGLHSMEVRQVWYQWDQGDAFVLTRLVHVFVV